MSGWPWPAVIAHRCGGALAPENTLAGLRIAAGLGCQAVEFDVMLSQDALPVLIHDEDLRRTAGRRGDVARLDSAALLATDVGQGFHPAFAGECIPSLAQALAACAAFGLAANVEIKPSAGREVETGRVVGRYLSGLAPAASPGVLLSSFSEAALAAAAAEAEGIPRAMLATRLSSAAFDAARRQACVALHLGRRNLQAAEVLAVREAGLRVQVYTVNSIEEAQRLIGWGVSGVFSDRPELLLAGHA